MPASSPQLRLIHLMFGLNLFPDSRAGRLFCMGFAIVFAGLLIRDSRHSAETEKAFADHGRIADVLPIDHYTQHSKRKSGSNESHDTYKSAELTFVTAEGQHITRTHDLEESEFQTLKNGGTLHIQYLPEDAWGSSRLEGHPKTTWIGYVLGGLLVLYALVLLL